MYEEYAWRCRNSNLQYGVSLMSISLVVTNGDSDVPQRNKYDPSKPGTAHLASYRERQPLFN